MIVKKKKFNKVKMFSLLLVVLALFCLIGMETPFYSDEFKPLLTWNEMQVQHINR